MDTGNQSSLLPPLGDGGKTLLLIRHAKSSWDNFALTDFDRPLNDRGKNDAPEMAKRLIDKKINIDAFISSPAKRAKKTAKLLSSSTVVSWVIGIPIQSESFTTTEP